MSRDELKKLQSEKLVSQVKHVWENVPYYRKKMEEKGITPDDIKGIGDLHKLPFITKDDLRETYPYGDNPGADAEGEYLVTFTQIDTTEAPDTKWYCRKILLT